MKPQPPPRHNRRHQKQPALLARGKAVYGTPPADLADPDLLAVEHYLRDLLTLPKGGIAYRKQVREEKKRRGI